MHHLFCCNQFAYKEPERASEIEKVVNKVQKQRPQPKRKKDFVCRMAIAIVVLAAADQDLPLIMWILAAKNMMTVSQSSVYVSDVIKH